MGDVLSVAADVIVNSKASEMIYRRGSAAAEVDGFILVESMNPQWFKYLDTAVREELLSTTYYNEKRKCFSFRAADTLHEFTENKYKFCRAQCYVFNVYHGGTFSVEINYKHIKNNFVLYDSSLFAGETEPILRLITPTPALNTKLRIHIDEILPFFYEWLGEQTVRDMQLLLMVLLARKKIKYNDFLTAANAARTDGIIKQ
jgi:hypothetical protein